MTGQKLADRVPKVFLSPPTPLEMPQELPLHQRDKTELHQEVKIYQSFPSKNPALTSKPTSPTMVQNLTPPPATHTHTHTTLSCSLKIRANHSRPDPNLGQAKPLLCPLAGQRKLQDTWNPGTSLSGSAPLQQGSEKSSAMSGNCSCTQRLTLASQ